MPNQSDIPTVSYEDYISAIALLKKTGARGIYELFTQKATTTPTQETIEAVEQHLKNKEPLHVSPPEIENNPEHAQFLSAATTLRDEGDYWSFTAPDGISVDPPSGTPEASEEDLANAEDYLRGKPMPITPFLK